MKEILQKDSIFKVGKVTSVEGRTIKIEVDKSKNGAHLLYKGQVLRNISVNGYVKITKGFTKIIGKVEGEFIFEDKQFVNKNYKSERQKIKRILQVSLLGFFSKKGFERGIKELPLINNECYLLDLEEFEDVHNFVKKEDDPLTLGTLTHENNQEIKVGVNDLFASHIGIFGNTGSGKSYTLAKIYRELFLKYIEEPKFKENAEFFFIDFNGEYINDNVILDRKHKNIYSLNTRSEKDKFPISQDLISDYNFWALVLEATEKTQKPFLKRAIENDWLEDKIEDAVNLLDFVKSLISKIIDKEDNSLKTGIIIDLLYNLGDCLGNNNINEISNILRNQLQFHNKNSTFYFVENNGNKHYDNDSIPFVEEILDQIDFDEIQDDYLLKIRLRIILQFHHEIINGYSNVEHLSPLLKRTPPRINDLRKVIVISDESLPLNMLIFK
jgi:hypothetical protein